MQASCPHLGCDYSVTGKDQSDVMSKLAEHDHKQHGNRDIEKDLKESIEKTFKP